MGAGGGGGGGVERTGGGRGIFGNVRGRRAETGVGVQDFSME